MTNPAPNESHDNLQPARLLVVGAGQIGTPLVERLTAEGHQVTWISRRVPPQIPDGARHVSLDASEGKALASQAQGARAILVAANPATYDAKVWARTLPPLIDGVIEAATRTDSRLVLLDALYLYALGHGPLSPDSPRKPSTEKGKVRNALAERVDRAQRGGTRITTLRASDFWGPGLHSALLTNEGIGGLEAGKATLLLGDPDAPHAFSHRDDVVEALCRLAFADADVEGQVFHAPVVHVTPRELVERLSAACGVRPRVRVAPAWMLRAAGMFSPMARGLVEMLPQWEQPYLVDDSRYTQRFGITARSLEAGVAQLAAARGAARSLQPGS